MIFNGSWSLSGSQVSYLRKVDGDRNDTAGRVSVQMKWHGVTHANAGDVVSQQRHDVGTSRLEGAGRVLGWANLHCQFHLVLEWSRSHTSRFVSEGISKDGPIPACFATLSGSCNVTRYFMLWPACLSCHYWLYSFIVSQNRPFFD